MADRYDILIWCMMIIPILFLGASLLTHPTYLYTEVHLSEQTIEENELKETLSQNEWNDYIKTTAEISKINKKSEQNNQNSCTCQINNSSNKKDYPTSTNVVFYHELNQDQKEIFSYLKSSKNNTLNRRIYKGDSFLYKYPQYNFKSYTVNDTTYSYEEIKPFLENKVIENSDTSFYIIEKTSTRKSKYSYLNNADYTFLLFFSFGFLMDYLNTVLKRNNRNKKKAENSNTNNNSDEDENERDQSGNSDNINIRDSEDLVDSTDDSDFDNLE